MSRTLKLNIKKRRHLFGLCSSTSVLGSSISDYLLTSLAFKLFFFTISFRLHGFTSTKISSILISCLIFACPPRSLADFLPKFGGREGVTRSSWLTSGSDLAYDVSILMTGVSSNISSTILASMSSSSEMAI